MLMLKAKEENWGLIGPGEWEKRSWKIDKDGWYRCKTSFRAGDADLPSLPDVETVGTLPADRLERLQELLWEAWSTETTEVSEGVAWEFKMYEDDKVIKYREMGYIEGIAPFEEIVSLLQDTEADTAAEV